MKNLTIRITCRESGFSLIDCHDEESTVSIQLTALSVGEAIDAAHGLLWYYLEKKGESNAQ